VSWKIMRDTSGAWSLEASRDPERKPDCFYVYSEAMKELRKRNRGRVAPNSEFENLFGPDPDGERLT
jgi:hypothetical protein